MKFESAESVLRYIVQNYGLDFLYDGRKLMACFAALAPNLQKENAMLSRFVACNGHIALLNARKANAPKPQNDIQRIVSAMVNSYYLSETFSREICDQFWNGIGGKTAKSNNHTEKWIIALGAAAGISLLLILTLLFLNVKKPGKKNFSLPTPAVGDVITFGKYEQNNNLSDGAEPIEWEVLEINGNTALLLSKYALDYSRYTNNQDRTWENSIVREWLNNTFLNIAFSAEETKIIQCTLIPAPMGDPVNGGEYPGAETNDRLFVPRNEIPENFENRKCKATPFAVSQAKKQGYTLDTEYCCWFMRTTEYHGMRAVTVMEDGQATSFGFSPENIYTYATFIRPAMRISLG